MRPLSCELKGYIVGIQCPFFYSLSKKGYREYPKRYAQWMQGVSHIPWDKGYVSFKGYEESLPCIPCRGIRLNPFLCKKNTMGCSQVVRHRNLDPTFKGSNPFSPAILTTHNEWFCFDMITLFFVFKKIAKKGYVSFCIETAYPFLFFLKKNACK